MRVVAVAQFGVERQAEIESLLRGLLLVQEARNGGVIFRSAVEDLPRQMLTRGHGRVLSECVRGGHPRGGAGGGDSRGRRRVAGRYR